MKEIQRNRFRPILLTIFWCWFFFNGNGMRLDLSGEEYITGISIVIFLISLLIFRIKEKISIENEYILFDLHNNKTKIKITSIKKIEFHDCFNIINIQTSESYFTLKLSQFHSAKVEKLFTENNLYKSENENETVAYSDTGN